MQDYRTSLLTVARAYGKATGRSLARTATMAMNHGAFFKRLEDGRTCTVDTYFKVMRWFSDGWPADTAWPDGVERPNSPAKPTPPKRKRPSNGEEAVR